MRSCSIQIRIKGWGARGTFYWRTPMT